MTLVNKFGLMALAFASLLLVGCGDAPTRNCDIVTVSPLPMNSTTGGPILSAPQGMVRVGNTLYIADSGANTISQVDVTPGGSTTGAWSILAGSGQSASKDGTGLAASFNAPVGIATDGSNLYVADAQGNTVRQVVIKTGQVTTLAGSGVAGSADGAALSASFNQPIGVAVVGGAVYVADSGNRKIRKIDLQAQTVSTLVGTSNKSGSSDGSALVATFSTLNGITTDGVNLYVTDFADAVTANDSLVLPYDAVRKITLPDGAVSTLAGGKWAVMPNRVFQGGTPLPGFAYTDGTGSLATFYRSMGIATDGVNLYVADMETLVIRRIVIATGEVTTEAGDATGVPGYTNGSGDVAEFEYPSGIAMGAPSADGSGFDLYVTDAVSVRKLNVVKSACTNNAAKSTTTSGSNPGGPYTISGTVIGMHGGDSLTLDKGNGETLDLTAIVQAIPGYHYVDPVSFAFSNTVPANGSYAVKISKQPSQAICSVDHPTGAGVNANVNLLVTCTPATHTISGTVSNLPQGASINVEVIGDVIAANDLAGAAQFSLDQKAQVTSNGPYSISLPASYLFNIRVYASAEDYGIDCNFVNGQPSLSGPLTADLVNVDVNCLPRQTPSQSYTIGGTITGLTSGQVVTLKDNGGDDLTLTAPANNFQFATPVSKGNPYSVTIGKQPSLETCSVSSGSGVVAGASVNSVSVNCSLIANSIGGTVNGLGLGDSVILWNNGSDALTVTGHGTGSDSFTFPMPVAQNGSYLVTVKTQPTSGKVCTVASPTGSGKATGSVANVTVNCAAQAYTVGGVLNGLASGRTVVLNNNGDVLSLTSSGSFTFSQAVAYGGGYNVIVTTQPVGQSCTVSNGAGTVTGSVTNLSVTCTTASFTIGGFVSGLSGSVLLQDNGGDTLTISSNGNFTFATPLPTGASYSATVLSSPVGQTCTVVSNGSGTVGSANVTNIGVNCVTSAPVGYTIGGVVYALLFPGLQLTLNAGLETLPLGPIGLGGPVPFNFATSRPTGFAYTVTVSVQPFGGQICTVTSGGSGTVPVGNVNNIVVNCH